MSLISDLYKINKKDIKKAANVLANAFPEDPKWEKVFEKEDQFRLMSELIVKFCRKYGNVFSPSDNLEGVMAITSHDKDMTFWRIIRSGAFFLSMKLASVFKKMAQTSKLIEEEKKNLDIGPYIYLMIIGVAQEFQGKGFGGKLLRALMEKADIERKSIYLETQAEGNVPLYEKYGFYVHKKINLPDLNIPMWLMIRNAK
ncbi:MAG: GNAT family N-acetyltransferase [Candidatus Helarchaeota archaeon]|nr:GNAT family N-acetyltransferase [Candidatus Helarchaeota archaeon]